MMQYLSLKPAQQTLSRHSGFARYSIPVLLSPRQRILNLILNRKKFFRRENEALAKQKPR
jgi:hypothetical protein